MVDPSHNRNMHLWRQRALSLRAEVKELRRQLLEKTHQLAKAQEDRGRLARDAGMAEYYRARFIEILEEMRVT